jgi:cell wall-associated NlpC family hydrolase
VTTGEALARAAESLVGSRFRLHGRDPATGLDCIGVLAAALAAIDRAVDFPSGYNLRTSDFPALAQLAARHGFAPAHGDLKAGDVLFVRSGPGQLHLMIAAQRPGWFIEAHAGLKRVTLRPGPLVTTIVQRWRIAAQA